MLPEKMFLASVTGFPSSPRGARYDKSYGEQMSPVSWPQCGKGEA